MRRAAALAALLAILPPLAGAAAPLRLHVAPGGSDRWSGRLDAPAADRRDGPLATLEGARDRLRALRAAGSLPEGAVVEIAGGIYEMARPLELTAADSGLPGKPIVFRARLARVSTLRPAPVRLVGGRVVRGWRPVTAGPASERLDPAARPHVLQADLRAQGLTDLPGIQAGKGWANSGPGLELFFQDRPMTLARWPNRGFVHIADTLGIDPYDIRGTWGDRAGKFRYEGERPARWVGEQEAWLHGYWFWDWADERQKVESIDTAAHTIALAKPWHDYGFRKGQWYYAVNILAELDAPGEWYLDRKSGILYFWPPAPIASAPALVSVLPELITLRGASHIRLERLTLEACRGTAITAAGGEGIRISGCTLRNCGGWAVQISGGRGSGVAGCDIYAMGDGGISLEGGDRRTLTPSGLYADNNHVHHYARWNPVYRPGITISGVGVRVTHNLIHNAPHMAMGFYGNDHTIAFNEIHSVCYESNDAGAIYAGRNWTSRGTVIRANYLHDISGFEGRGCVGVYLDDQWSGTQIDGNLFWRVSRAAMIGGGRDCSIVGNTFVDCVPSVHVDARGLGWAAPGEAGMRQTLAEMPYQTPPWSDRYPKLPPILQEEPMAPRGNVIARNRAFGGTWSDIEAKALPMVDQHDNRVTSAIDAPDRPSAPAVVLAQMRDAGRPVGPYPAPERASWPVRHAVRPAALPPAARRATPAPVCRVPLGGPGALITLGAAPDGAAVPLPSTAVVRTEGRDLVVAIGIPLPSGGRLVVGRTWGQADAVEVAFAGRTGPTAVLRGYVDGGWESSGESGIAPDAARAAAAGVRYTATRAGAAGWSCIWRIPRANLLPGPRCPANFSVRRTADDRWQLWVGTGGRTWEVDKAGLIALPAEKAPKP